MQLQVPDSADPVGEALKWTAEAAKDHTENHPLTPELFWVHLTEHGFGFRGNPPGSDEHGRFFAHLVLDHAVAVRLVTGNTALHHYWSI
ncbi:MAG: hypothetical protein L3K02_02220 [Thermoplasmata archaeon]|nr:hypothetical protein [Thermoplasmata archaeon]